MIGINGVRDLARKFSSCDSAVEIARNPFHFRSSSNFSIWIESPYRVSSSSAGLCGNFSLRNQVPFLDGHSGRWSYNFRSTSIRNLNDFHVDHAGVVNDSFIEAGMLSCCQEISGWSRLYNGGMGHVTFFAQRTRCGVMPDRYNPYSSSMEEDPHI